MVDVKPPAASIPREIFHDPSLPIEDEIFIDKLKIREDFSNLPKICSFIAAKFNMREKDIENSIIALLEKYAEVNNHVNIDVIPGNPNSGEAPPSNQFNSIRIQKTARGAQFTIVEKNQMPQLAVLANFNLINGARFQSTVYFVEHKPIQYANSKNALVSFSVATPNRDMKEFTKPALHSGGEFERPAKPTPSLEKMKQLSDDIFFITLQPSVQDHAESSEDSPLLIGRFKTNKPVSTARFLIDLDLLYSELSNDDQAEFVAYAGNYLQPQSSSKKNDADFLSSLIDFLNDRSDVKNHLISNLKEIVRKNTPTFPLSSFGAVKTSQGQIGYNTGKKYAERLSWIMGHAINGESAQITMGAVIQSLRNLLGNAEHTLSSEETMDLKNILRHYEKCFFEGNEIQIEKVTFEVQIFENNPTTKNKKIPKKNLPGLLNTEAKLVNALSDKPGSDHLFQVTTNNHALLIEVTHKLNEQGEHITTLSVFDSGGRPNIDRSNLYLTPEERGKVLQERKIDITTLVKECQSEESDISFITIADNILEQANCIQFGVSENGEAFVQRRGLNYYEKLNISETFNRKMTTEINNIIPWKLRDQCPDVIDESTILRRPQRIGDCQIDVILSHFSHRCKLNSSYLKFKSHFLKEAAANLASVETDQMKTMLRDYIESELSPNKNHHIALSNKSKSAIGRMFNRVNEDLNEISWMNRSSDNMDLNQSYLHRIGAILTRTLEEFDSLPDEAFIEFKQFAISVIGSRIEKNEQRIAAKKDKTRLYTDKEKAKVIFHGKQYADRSPDYSVNRAFIDYLTKNAVPGAKFRNTQASSLVWDGACTAMSLTMAKHFKEVKRTLKSSGIKNRQARTKEALDEISKDVKYKTATSKMRSIQALFNNFELTGEEGVDPGRAKMDLMAHVMGMRVVYSTKEINLNQKQVTAQLEKILLKLEDGTYVLRMINDEPNNKNINMESNKGENYGHTTILIKNEGELYLYNPNDGGRELDKNSLVKLIKAMNKNHKTPKTRFHQLKVNDKNSIVESLTPTAFYHSKSNKVINDLKKLSSASGSIDQRLEIIHNAILLLEEINVVNSLIENDNKPLQHNKKIHFCDTKSLSNTIDTAINCLIADISDDRMNLKLHNERKDNSHVFYNSYYSQKPIKGGYYDISKKARIDLIDTLRSTSKAETRRRLDFIDTMMSLLPINNAGIHSMVLPTINALFPRQKAVIAYCEKIFPELGGCRYELNNALKLIDEIEDIPAVMSAIEENPELLTPKTDNSNPYYYSYAQSFTVLKFKNWLQEKGLIKADDKTS